MLYIYNQVSNICISGNGQQNALMCAVHWLRG